MEFSSKVKVAGLNLLSTQVLLSLIVGLMWFFWFPSPFADISGFSRIIQVMVLTNICLGPLLIFIIYKKNKRHLKFDLAILAVIQISAIIFGLYSLYLKHPVYVVFTIDRFTLVNAQDATPEKVRDSQLVTSFFSSPKLVFAKRPENADKRKALLFSVLFDGKPDLDRRAEYYEPFANHLESVLESSISTKLLFPDDISRKKLTYFLEKHGGTEHDYAYFPLQGNTGKDLIWVLDRKRGEPVGSIDSDPWQMASQM